MKVNIKKIFHFFILILLFFILENRYYNFVHKYYFYHHFTYEFVLSKFIFSKFLFLISILFLLLKQSKFIYSLSILLNLFVLIPNLILYQYTDYPITIIFLILLFLLLLPINFFKRREFKFAIIKENNKLIILTIAFIIFLIPFFIEYGFKFDFRVFSFGKIIYKIRENLDNSGNIFTAYLYSPLRLFILPCVLILSLIKRKWISFILASMAIIYLYMIFPQKSTFFALFITIAFFFYRDYFKKINFILISIMFILITCIILSEGFNYNLPESLLIRRTFFIPALLNDAYFTLFKNNYLFLSHSILSPFIGYPYDVKPAIWVAEIFFKTQMNANNGIISDGYKNFGIIGAIIFVFIAAYILKFIDKLNISSRFFGIFFLILRLFIGSALLTGLLTHGILVAILISFLFLHNTKIKY